MNYLLEAALSFGFVPQLGLAVAHSIIVRRTWCTLWDEGQTFNVFVPRI